MRETSATIGYKQQDCTLRVVYCHFDRHPRITARTLAAHYKTPNCVERLISRGNLFAVVPGHENVVYFVDRGVSADVVAPTIVETERELLERHQHKSFYIFDNGLWKTHTRGIQKNHEWYVLPNPT